MVWLKSGANIIIEQLETLTFIDVNTSGSRSLKSNSIFSVNAEAAKEAAKQLKLRNISGMIIIDFINMKNPEEKNELIKILKEEIKKDLLELHLFDAVGEYRYIKTRKGEIEVYINDENMDYQDTYVERIYTLGKNVEKTDKNADKVEVVNYISYDENDLMVIRNYRLKEVE